MFVCGCVCVCACVFQKLFDLHCASISLRRIDEKHYFFSVTSSTLLISRCALICADSLLYCLLFNFFAGVYMCHHIGVSIKRIIIH